MSTLLSELICACHWFSHQIIDRFAIAGLADVSDSRIPYGSTVNVSSYLASDFEVALPVDVYGDDGHRLSVQCDGE